MADPIDMEWAVLRFHRNEVSLDGKAGVDDPVKYRGGSFLSESLNIISGDHLSGDTGSPARAEKVMIMLKRYGPGPTHGGMVEIFVQDWNTSDDAGMRRAITITPDQIEFHKPVKMLPCCSQQDTLVSSNGKYKLVMQGDGNLVIYRQDGSVRWASNTNE